MGSGCGARKASYRAVERDGAAEINAGLPPHKSYRTARVGQPAPLEISSDAGISSCPLDQPPAAPVSVSVAGLKQRLRELGRKIPDGVIEKTDLLALLEEAEKEKVRREAAKGAREAAKAESQKVGAAPTSPPASSMNRSPRTLSPPGQRSVGELKRRLRDLNLEIPINIFEKKDLVALVEAAERQQHAREEAARPTTAAQPRSVAQLKSRLQDLGVKVPTGAVEKRELFILLEEAERQQDSRRPDRTEGTASESPKARSFRCEKGCRGVTHVTVTEEPFTPVSPSIDSRVVKGEKFTWTKGKLIGRGALGLVYRAEAEGKVIAVKEVTLDGDDNRESQFRIDLENEITIMQDLKHPFVVSYLGHDYIDDRIYMYMDFMPGGSLSSVLKDYGPLDESLMAKYLKQLLTGLDYLHNRQPSVIHRDIKGANVLVGLDSIVKWADFGCSKSVDSEKTQTGMRGSIPWMAPEVVAKSRYGKSSDIWSFGCLAIEMGTARTPWGTFENQVQALIKIGMSNDTPPFPEGVSEDCHSFISQCIQREAQLRACASDLLHHNMVRDIPLPM